MPGKQHVEYHRKVAQRQRLVEAAGLLDGDAWIPFCGDGDLTADVWAHVESLGDLYAADLDPARVATFSARFADREDIASIVGDCDEWILPIDTAQPLAVIDLDSYAWPYSAWHSTISTAELADTVVVMFTDTVRQSIKRKGTWRTPDGEQHSVTIPDGNISALPPEAREVYNQWWAKIIEPWWTQEVDRLGYVQVATEHYLRGDTLYWGSVIRKAAVHAMHAPERADTPGTAVEPMKFTAEVRARFLDRLREGVRRGKAARSVGVDPSTVRRYAQRVPEFADEMRLAEDEAHEEVEDALFLAAKSGNVTAMIFYLTNRQPDRWADRRRPNTVQIPAGQNTDVDDGEPDGGEFDVEAVAGEIHGWIDEVGAQRAKKAAGS